MQAGPGGTVYYSGLPDAGAALSGAARFARTTARRTATNLEYARPSGYQKGVRDAVWTAAEDAGAGLVRDPLTQSVMVEHEAWDMGHRPGYEFTKHAASAEERGISRTDFLAEHNNPDHFRPELPSNNRGHYLGAPDDAY